MIIRGSQPRPRDPPLVLLRSSTGISPTNLSIALFRKLDSTEIRAYVGLYPGTRAQPKVIDAGSGRVRFGFESGSSQVRR